MIINDIEYEYCLNWYMKLFDTTSDIINKNIFFDILHKGVDDISLQKIHNTTSKLSFFHMWATIEYGNITIRVNEPNSVVTYISKTAITYDNVFNILVNVLYNNFIITDYNNFKFLTNFENYSIGDKITCKRYGFCKMLEDKDVMNVLINKVKTKLRDYNKMITAD